MTIPSSSIRFTFFFNDTATTEIYTLSLHDALPIYVGEIVADDHFLAANDRDAAYLAGVQPAHMRMRQNVPGEADRSEEHTSELQSPDHLVCRLLLEKKNINMTNILYCHFCNNTGQG